MKIASLEIEETIFSWIFSQVPTIGTLFLLIVATAWITSWVNKAIAHYKGRLEKVETGHSQLELTVIAIHEKFERFDKKFEIINSRLDRVDRRLEHFDRKFERLTAHLIDTKKIKPDALQKRSPLQLTEFGMRILIDMGGKQYVDSRLESLLNKMESRDFKSALDVENYCMILLHDSTNDDEMTPVKDFIFNNPTYGTKKKERVDMDILFAIKIMGVYLRNQYFEKHPELLIASSKINNDLNSDSEE